jgi:hypothetical protein
MQPGSALEPLKEPNNVAPPEYCAVANYSQTYGKPTAWGWSDINCAKNFVFMCRLQSGWQRCWRRLHGSHICSLQITPPTPHVPSAVTCRLTLSTGSCVAQSSPCSCQSVQ